VGFQGQGLLIHPGMLPGLQNGMIRAAKELDLVSMTTPEEPITPDQVLTARRAWQSAVEARDVEAVASLYDPEYGQLLGTMDTAETARRQTPQRIRDYFENFLSADALRVEFHRPVTLEDVIPAGPGFATHSGYYDFAITKDGMERVLKGTFTFVYRRDEAGRLWIVTHNSGLTSE